MWEKLLIIGIVIVSIYFIHYLTRWRKKERGIPVFKVKAVRHPVLSQPVLQTTAVFTYERDEQDRILRKKYYRGRSITAENREFKIADVKKIPAGNWRDTCYYRMYFEEYQGREFPRRFQIIGHVRYWKCVCLEKGMILYDHVGNKKPVVYNNIAVFVQKKKMTLILLPDRRRLSVFYRYNFNINDFELFQELLIKYANLARKKR